MSRYFDLSDFYNESGELSITDVGVENLKSLATIVLNTHFSYVNACDREDLIQIGLLKALELLNAGTFDPSRSSLKNYLYTGIRNEIKNYLYRSSKEIAVGDEILTGLNESTGEISEVEVTLTYISTSLLVEVLRGFKEPPKDKILSTLNSIGFDTEDKPSVKGYFPEVEPWVALIIWMQIEQTIGGD